MDSEGRMHRIGFDCLRSTGRWTDSTGRRKNRVNMTLAVPVDTPDRIGRTAVALTWL